MEQRISIERMEQAVNLFGSFDENVRLIESEFKVTVSNREGELRVNGEVEDTMLATKALNALLTLSNRGEPITEQNVRYVISLVRAGQEDRISELTRIARERDLTPEMSSPLHIVPGGYDDVRRAIGWPGTKGVMKVRRSLADTKRILREEGAFDGAELVEDCGLPGERVYRSLDDVPDRGSYFSTMVVR